MFVRELYTYAPQYMQRNEDLPNSTTLQREVEKLAQYNKTFKFRNYLIHNMKLQTVTVTDWKNVCIYKIFTEIHNGEVFE